MGQLGFFLRGCATFPHIKIQEYEGSRQQKGSTRQPHDEPQAVICLPYGCRMTSKRKQVDLVAWCEVTAVVQSAGYQQIAGIISSGSV